MADDTDADDWPGYTPEEMYLPTDLVERIRLVCSLLHLPVAERHGMRGWRSRVKRCGSRESRPTT
ncbi:hypothetical protein [Streptomyces puniciscabiei]|uniref:hypothetical protein n=1 Tax=Streptomyces puniciscabiei TaxID=164348 RepID=UPI00331D8EBE